MYKIEIFDESPELDVVPIQHPTTLSSSELIFQSVSSSIASDNPDYPQALACILKNITEICNAEFAVSFVIQAGVESTFFCAGLFETTPGSFFPGQEKRKISYRDDSIFKYIVKNRICVISSDISKDVRSRIDNSNIPDGHPVIKAFIGIPLEKNGETIGVLAIGNSISKDSFTPDMIYKMEYLLDAISLLSDKISILEPKTEKFVKSVPLSNALKDRFLATISHEIRTPLNGITGMITMLDDAGPLNKKQAEYVRNLTECVYQLTNLMNNILDFSKMTSNRFQLSRVSFSLQDVISDSLRMTEGSAIAKGVDIILDIPQSADLPIFIGDPRRIIQILTNLISNGIKFTEKGYVKISVKVKAAQRRYSSIGKGVSVMFVIEDTGTGIPAEEQAKIFDVFHQGSNLTTYMSRAGTGLGLSIVRELVRLMGGKIVVRSPGIPGHGSTFSFNIILDSEINVETLGEECAELLRGKHILAIDDRQEIRLQLTETLLKWGCIPFVVESAEEGLRYISGGMTFSVYIIDICMPGMSGIELAHELRKITPDVPRIGLSSMDINEGEDNFDYYMRKPVSQNQLFPALVDALKNTKKGKKNNFPSGRLVRNISKSSPRKTRVPKHQLKILIAEDDERNAYTISEMLLNLGYKNFERVANGKECVNKVNEQHFDVILLDIIMPIMDGLDAAKKIKRIENPPYIIAVSAAVLSSDKEKGMEAGINHYLGKPLTKQELDEALKPFVIQRKQVQRKKSHRRGTKIPRE